MRRFWGVGVGVAGVYHLAPGRHMLFFAVPTCQQQIDDGYTCSTVVACSRVCVRGVRDTQNFASCGFEWLLHAGYKRRARGEGWDGWGGVVSESGQKKEGGLGAVCRHGG